MESIIEIFKLFNSSSNPASFLMLLVCLGLFGIIFYLLRINSNKDDYMKELSCEIANWTKTFTELTTLLEILLPNIRRRKNG